MSNSYRKNPYIGWAGAGPSAQKKFRSQENRAKRRQVKVKLSVSLYDNMPHEKEYGNEWASPRDGKCRMRNPEPKWMRK